MFYVILEVELKEGRGSFKEINFMLISVKEGFSS